MNLVALGLALLSILNDGAYSCSIKVLGQSCKKVPFFEQCSQPTYSATLSLVSIYTSVNIREKDSTYWMMQFLASYKFTFKLSYSQPEGFIELQLFSNNSCFDQSVHFLAISYRRRLLSNVCPKIYLYQPNDGFYCDPPYFALRNILIINNFILIRGKQFGFLFTTNSEPSTPFWKMPLFESLIIFSLWFTDSFKTIPLEDSTNCSTLDQFSAFYDECFRLPLNAGPVQQFAKSNQSYNQQVTAAPAAESTPMPKGLVTPKDVELELGKREMSELKVAAAIVFMVVIVLAALIAKNSGLLQRSNRVHP